MKNEIKTHKQDIGVLMFLDIFPREQNVTLHSEVISALHEKYPEHLIVKDRWNYMNSPASRVAIGAIAPDLEFPDPDGKMRKLSDLRGKVVLLDFWASWCGPCRRENPNVTKIYAQYHDKGFEVFSVSLDSDAASWKRAIEADKLVWPNHVSDLKKWQSQAAAIYGVRSIPSTFLLDKEGRIVQRDLRGADLERAVKQLVEQ
jgi:peroxiredoxin